MDLLITVLALLVAVYAVIPRDRQLDLRLKVGVLDWAVLAFSFGFVSYLEFYDFFLARDWVFSRPWPQGLTPRNTIYLVMTATLVFLAVRIRLRRLTPSKVREFRDLIEELYWNESYGELFGLLQNHLHDLRRISTSDYWPARIQKKETAQRFLVSLTAVEDELPKTMDTRELSELGRTKGTRTRIGTAARTFTRNAASQLGLWVLPNYEEAAMTAREINRNILLSRRFISALTRTRPYFALKILRHLEGTHELFDFVDLYLRQLLGDAQSVLFEEVRNNQNTSKYRYQLPESNRILSFFFSDAGFANKVSAWKPIGDFVLSYLDDLALKKGADPYNRPLNDFPDREAWDCPIFVGIRIFDIMVKEALFQNVSWHMWLYYLPLIVDKIVPNYFSVELIPGDPTMSTRYSFLLSEAFGAMRDWAEA